MSMAAPTSARAITTAPSKSSTRRSASIRRTATAYYNRGSAYSNKRDYDGDIKDFDEAIKLIERAIALEPKNSEIRDHLGDAYWRMGSQDEARKSWGQALSLKPDPADAGEDQGQDSPRAGKIEAPGGPSGDTDRPRSLLALSGHRGLTARCPLLGVKRTFQAKGVMSANDPKQTSTELATSRVPSWSGAATILFLTLDGHEVANVARNIGGARW